MDNNTSIPIMRGIHDTAIAFGVTEYYMRQLAISGKVAAVRVGKGGKILINQNSVSDYFNNSYISTDDERK